jgi:hypothetical protein
LVLLRLLQGVTGGGGRSLQRCTGLLLPVWHQLLLLVTWHQVGRLGLSCHHGALLPEQLQVCILLLLLLLLQVRPLVSWRLPAEAWRRLRQI